MSRFFDSELASFRSLISRMLLLNHQQLQLAVEGLLNHRPEKAQQVIDIEEEVDQLEIELDSESLRFLSLRSPIASELRLIMSGSKMGHEFERIGDESKKIAKRCLRNKNKSIPEEFALNFRLMYEVVETMIETVQVVFDSQNDQLASEVIERDNIVDTYNRDLQDIILHEVDNTTLQLKFGVDLIACCRAMERIGDHIKNIAEILIFLNSGLDVRDE